MVEEPKEKEILRLLEAKDPSAFEALYAAYHERLAATAIHFLGYEDPDHIDVVQETFAVALKKLPGVRIETNLYGWLNRVCALLCFERLRLRKRQLSGLQDELEGLASGLSARRHEQGLEEAEKQSLLDLLKQKVADLGGACREIITLRDMQGLSYAELAQKLKIPMGTAMSRLARCRQELKRMVEVELKRRRA